MEVTLFQKNNGCFCWISVNDFKGGVSEQYKVKGLEKGDVLTGYISYPLKNPKKAMFRWDENRFKLCEQICDYYRRIYEEEEQSPGLYGIWGHGIEDLVIEQIRVDTDNKLIKLSIGS